MCNCGANERWFVMGEHGLLEILQDRATLRNIQANERFVVSGTEGRRSLPDLVQAIFAGRVAQRGIFPQS